MNYALLLYTRACVYAYQYISSLKTALKLIILKKTYPQGFIVPQDPLTAGVSLTHFR